MNCGAGKKVCAALVLICAAAAALAAQNAADSPAMREADALLKGQKWAEAAKAYEALTMSEPANGRAWARLGTSLHAAGRYAEAVEAFRRQEKLQFNRGAALFGIARAYARLGEKEKAFAALRGAVEAGWFRTDVLEKDPQLDPLRDDARFKEVAALMIARTRPCTRRPEYRQLDFLVGEWEVRGPMMPQPGASSVRLILGDCVVSETYVVPFYNYSSQALHQFDAKRGKWVLRVVDTVGDYWDMAGEFRDGAMRYAQEPFEQNGVKLLQRSSYTRLDADSVRVNLEQSADGGKTWNSIGDVTYYRRK